jgi:hypothetical protein
MCRSFKLSATIRSLPIGGMVVMLRTLTTALRSLFHLRCVFLSVYLSVCPPVPFSLSLSRTRSRSLYFYISMVVMPLVRTDLEVVNALCVRVCVFVCVCVCLLAGDPSLGSFPSGISYVYSFPGVCVHVCVCVCVCVCIFVWYVLNYFINNVYVHLQ